MNRIPSPRRQFIVRAAALAAAGPLASWQARAVPLSGSDYRALVCVFLYGGNDANNMVVPTDSANYADYAKARGNAASGGLTLQQSSLAPLAGSNLGLHASLAPLAQVWNEGHLAVQANIGPLVRPLTKAQYNQGGAAVPPNLFSHSDQQMQWQRGVSGTTGSTGWAGRVADLQPSAAVPMVLSVSGNNVFMNGATTQGLAIGAKGGFAIAGFGSNPSRHPLYALYSSLLTLPYANAEERAAADVLRQALQASEGLNSALTTAGSTAGLFAGQNNSIAQQLLQVARLIEARSSLGVTRQIFFVSLGGFDTHNNQLPQQADLFGQLGPAMLSFYQAMQQLGVSSSVTTFTASDFARTLQPASGAGSDHAWGSHHFVMGGAVHGGVYGAMPKLVLGGPDDVSDEGRWLPTTSVDQMSATLSTWLGVGSGDLNALFPHLANFASRNLGYFG